MAQAQAIPRLVIKNPIKYSLVVKKEDRTYPHEIRLRLKCRYNKSTLEVNEEKREYFKGFYVLYSRGYIELYNSSRSNSVLLDAEITKCWISGREPHSIDIYSKPLMISDIKEFDEKLRTGDLELKWNINAYGLLRNYDDIKQYNLRLLPIFIGSEGWLNFSRTDFVKNILEPIDMLKREFIEVAVEPIKIERIKDSEIKKALKLLSEKQKLLLDSMKSLATAKTTRQYRDILGGVRGAVEGLRRSEEIQKIGSRIIRELGKITSSDPQALAEGSEEMISTIIGSHNGDRRFTGLMEATFYFTSRFGIHTETLQSKKPYVPNPTIEDAEFAIQQALIELNYLIRLFNQYA